jgi:pimeloyl-ACP methyl ester carboxylesterase
MHPARFARALVPHGFACLGFDYRGFARSEGVRGRVVPEEQVEDVRAAVSFLAGDAEIDPDRIALLGWALGGGVAIAAASEDRRVRGVAAVNAIGNGERSVRSTHEEGSWRALLERIARDRRRRAEGERPGEVAPFDVVRLDEVTLGYVEDELTRFRDFGSPVTLESAEQLLRFRPEEQIGRIAPRPVLLVHGDRNGLHPPGEAAELYRRAGEPSELVLLEGAGHTEWMHDGHPTFLRLVTLVSDFLARTLG